MKRLILTTTGTVAGLAALLSFKTQSHPLANAGPLPSAGASSAAGEATAPSATSPSSQPTASKSTASKSTASKSTASAAAKTYVGQAITTRYGVVQVKATVSGGKITNVAFMQLTAFDGRSEQINSYAAPQLLQETMQQQTANVDTISGASYTSDGYRQSLQSALDQAGIK